MKKAEAYASYKQMFDLAGDDLFGKSPALPDLLKDAVVFTSFARVLRVLPPDQPVSEEATLSKEQIEQLPKAKREQVEKAIKEQSRMFGEEVIWAFTIPELHEHLKNAVKSGEVSRLGKRILKRPVYTLQYGGERGESKTENSGFAYASDSEELLVAESFETLEAMVNAGMGLGSRMLDNQDYVIAFDYLPEEGQVLQVVPNMVVQRFQLERMREGKEEEEVIQKKEEKLEHEVICNIQNINVTDSLIISQSSLFQDEEQAKTYYTKVAGEFDSAAKELKGERKNIDTEIEKSGKKLNKREKRMVNMALGFAGNLLESQQTTIKDTLVTTTITFGKKQLNTLNMLITFAKAMEEKEKKQEKAKEHQDK